MITEEHGISKMIGEEKAWPEAVKQMKDSPANYGSTRWAAYQNHALDSANCGLLQFLAVGPDNTCKEAPERFPADTSLGMGWRYLHVGWVNLETGEVEPKEQERGEEIIPKSLMVYGSYDQARCRFLVASLTPAGDRAASERGM